MFSREIFAKPEKLESKICRPRMRSFTCGGECMSYEIGGTWEENFDGITMQCAGVVEDGNVIAAAFDEDFYIAKERASTIASCMNDRDTYRDLCADLLSGMKDIYFNGNCCTTDLTALITKAESILGEKNGNGN